MPPTSAPVFNNEGCCFREIPVDTKLIQDPGMHSMPHVTMAPNRKFLFFFCLVGSGYVSEQDPDNSSPLARHIIHPLSERWVAAQSMDNKISIFQIVDEKIRLSRKKTFRGHMVSGYACGVDFAPDMRYDPVRFLIYSYLNLCNARSFSVCWLRAMRVAK